MSVAVRASASPRNISVTAVVDKERHDLLDELARSLGITKSLAVTHLIDLHAGIALEEIAKAPAERFLPERARARRLSGELVIDVASLVREGMTKADAYRRLGVNARTANAWEKKGREEFDAGRGGLHADLVTALEQARAAFNHDLIREAVRKGDYKVLLKLIDPEQFTPQSRSQVDHTHRFQLLIEWDKLTIEETRLLAALLKKASPLEDDPAVTRLNRPSVEAIPADVVEMLEAEDGEWAPAEARALEAPALDDQKPQH